MEYRDPSNRGRWIVIIGVVLALAAGGAAFYLINQAQQQAGRGELATVSVFLSAQVNVPQDLATAGKYYTDKSTKISYQNMLILAKAGGSYIVKATLAQSEEIAHLVATGNAQFSMVMRPTADIRYADA